MRPYGVYAQLFKTLCIVWMIEIIFPPAISAILLVNDITK